MKGIKRATLVVAVLSFIYIASSFLLLGTAYSLRMWVDVIGKLLLIIVLPLLLLIWGGMAFCRVVEGKRGIKVLLGLLVTGMYGVWAFLALLFMMFSLQEERWLTKSLLVVNHGVALDEARYQCYRPVAFLLRTPCEFDAEQRARYLEEEYGRAFSVNREGAVYDVKNPELSVDVDWLGTYVEDNYIPLLWQKYFKEAYEALELSREYYASQETDGSTGWIYLELEGEEDITALAEDATALILHVMQQTDFFADYPVYLHFYQGEGEERITGSLPLGNVSQWHKLEEEYYKSSALVAERITSEYGKGLERLAEKERFDAEWEKQQESVADSEGKETEIEEPVISSPEIAAKLIYDKVLKEQGYSYVVKFNAKGNLYIALGSYPADGGEEYFTLVYDRPSKNGACELFVLYKERKETGEGPRILEMYAVEMDTENVIASGRRSWSDVGSEEYLKATGE